MLLNGEDDESRALEPTTCPLLRLGLTHLKSLASVGAASKFAGFLRKHRIDVVQTYFLDSTYFAVPLARLCGIREVWRVRNNVGYWLTKQHRHLGRWVGKLCGYTLTNSEAAQTAVCEAEGLAQARVRVLENGVDLERFDGLRPSSVTGELVRIGAVANLRAIKNVDGLIRVAENLCQRYPHLRFEIAGEGPMRPALERQIAAASLQERFCLRGSVADIPSFLGSLDIAVLCSHSESMSNALLEYMAAGRTIVVTDVGANSRLLRHEIDGLLVPVQSDIALEQALLRVLASPLESQQFAQSAQQRAKDEFSRAAMVRRFEEMLLSAKRHR